MSADEQSDWLSCLRGACRASPDEAAPVGLARPIVANGILLHKPTQGGPLGVSLRAQSGQEAISAISPSSPGAAAGLQQGDIILAVNGAVALSLQQIASALREAPAGPVRLLVGRARTAQVGR